MARRKCWIRCGKVQTFSHFSSSAPNFDLRCFVLKQQTQEKKSEISSVRLFARRRRPRGRQINLSSRVEPSSLDGGLFCKQLTRPSGGDCIKLMGAKWELRRCSDDGNCLCGAAAAAAAGRPRRAVSRASALSSSLHLAAT